MKILNKDPNAYRDDSKDIEYQKVGEPLEQTQG